MSTATEAQWVTHELTWRNLVAAFWSIVWPGSILGFSLLGFYVEPENVHRRALILSLASQAVFLLSQAILVPRLYLKKYRQFRIEVERDTPGSKQSLSINEITQVAIRIVSPQAVFIIANIVIVNWLNLTIEEQHARAISTLLFWIRFLVIGPYSVQYALRSSYSGFKLRTQCVRTWRTYP